jgi:hypothetical protein
MTEPVALAAPAIVLVAMDASTEMSLGELRALYRACAGRAMAAALHLRCDYAEAGRRPGDVPRAVEAAGWVRWMIQKALRGVSIP